MTLKCVVFRKGTREEVMLEQILNHRLSFSRMIGQKPEMVGKAYAKQGGHLGNEDRASCGECLE